MKIKLVFAVFLISIVGWGQASLPTSFSGSNWQTGLPTDWSQTGFGSDYGTNYDGIDGNAGKMDSTGDNLIINFVDAPGNITYYLGGNSLSGSYVFDVLESSNGSSYTIVRSHTSTSNSIVNTLGSSWNSTLLSTTRYVKFIYTTKASGSVGIDGVLINSLSPIITLSTSSLTGFAYISGNGPSANKTFTASGSNLTSNITLTAPANYEISLASGSGFTNALTLIQSSGTVSATTIYAQLKAGLALGNYNSENITATSTSATTQNVNCNGTVSASLSSDIIGVGLSEATTISSLKNDNTVTTITDGTQVWQFKVRDGGNNGADGVALNDVDNLPTILTGFTISKDAGSEIGIWSDAINTISLFDGAAFITTGIVNSTSIVFSGLNVSVNDNSEKTLSLRLSLKCPLGTDAFDDEDFAFSISNSNVTFSTSGSNKMSFSARKSANGSNKISVVATKLIYTLQPSHTGNGASMSTVTVAATDVCGNVDLGFTGTVSLTSTGTMTGTPLTVNAVAGVATFNNIVHTVVGTGYNLTATGSGLTSITSNTFDITDVVVLQPGDIAILALNTGNSSGYDEVSFVTFVDLKPGTRIDMTDNAYQKCGTSNGWGVSEGWVRFERTNTILPAGSIVTINVDNGNPSVVSPDPSNWIATKPQPSSQGNFNLNSTGEQLFFMSGGDVGGLNNSTSTSDAGTYSGYFLYGFNTKGDVWTPICGDSAAGGSKNSDKPLNFDCFLTWPTSPSDLNKYNGPITPATHRDWIGRIDDANNWATYNNNTAYNAGPNFNNASLSIITSEYSNGVWIGDKSANWFECGNWQSLKVPDETVDVDFGDATQNAIIDYTSSYSDGFLDIAKCNNLTISNFKLQIEANRNNKLEVHGNLTISGGQLDMDDSNDATEDGQVYIYGNWTNNATEAEFQEGNSTVHIVGSVQQVINSNNPNTTETFYNIILDNDFETKNGNSIIANGDFTINTNKNLTIGDGNYVKIGNNFSIGIGGVLDIVNRGSLVMVNDSGIVTNNGTMHALKTTPQYEQYDYTYWSSPMVSTTIASALGNWRNDWTLQFEAANYSDISPFDGFDDDRNDWSVVDQSATMSPGKGYAAMAPTSGTFPTTDTVTFTGTVNNGVITTPILLSQDSQNEDDDYNLIGNPYPSAIFADDFINENPNISGTLYFWTHVGTRTTGNPGPDQYNYSANDYAIYNLTGGNAATSPPDPTSGSSAVPTGDIVSGQAFMIEAVSSGNVTFNNAMRLKGISNNIIVANDNFYRNSPEVKDRIWISLQNNLGVSSPQLVGYLPESTQTYDRAYDGLNNVVGGYLNFYSVLENQNYKIQSRGDFDPNDKVTLGYNLQNAGELKIKINTAEGVLSNGDVNVYIEDKLLNITHNLKMSDYVFTSETGQFNDRFVLKYIDENLSTDDFENSASQLIVAGSNQTIQIKSNLEPLKNIAVYDILGRLIFEKVNINNTYFSIANIKATQQALIIKTTLENGQVVTRKIFL